MVCPAYDVVGCTTGCPYNVAYYVMYGCLAEFDAVNSCLVALQPSDFVCFNSNKPVQKAGLCAAEIMAYEDCFAEL
jgi:hypothetical protein